MKIKPSIPKSQVRKPEKQSTKELLDKLKNNKDSTKKVDISEEVYQILCWNNTKSKIVTILQEDYLVEDLLMNWSTEAMVLLKRFINIWWNWLITVLNQITQDNPFLVLQILWNSRFKKLYYSTYRTNNLELKNISRKAKRKIERIINIWEKYEQGLI